MEKNLELFIDLRSEKITIPRAIYSPGSFFPFARILSRESKRIYAPNGALTLSSGARSTFMLPNIGCVTNHVKLQRDFNIKANAPKTLYDHWYVFKEIVHNAQDEWKSCLIYFSQLWIDKILNDPNWIPLKNYFHELGWKYTEYERNRFCYDFTFSIMQRKRNLKPNPYLVDTARHLFTTALGAAPGYIPCTDENALPLNLIQNAYIESYDLKKYAPIVLQPNHFNYENDITPIYYSLQHPSTHIFSPRSVKESSTLTEMRELEHIMKVFIEELKEEQNICSDTVIGQASHRIHFDYFHSKPDPHRIIKLTKTISSEDKRFNFNDTGLFAADATFLRGCVSIKVS